MRLFGLANFALLVCSVSLLVAGQTPTPAPDGAALYAEHCAMCHDGEDSRAPDRDALQRRAPQAIVDALTSGSMKYQGMPLNGLERRAVAVFVTGRPLRAGEPLETSRAGRCSPPAPFGDPTAAPSWNGWSPALDNRHFQDAKNAGLTAAQVPQLTLKWAFGFADAAASWSQATVAGGRLFVGSQNGVVYALSASRGCVAWTFTAHAGVRAAVVVDKRFAYFADQSGFVYAVDAASGRLQWSRHVEEHMLIRLTSSRV